MLYYIGVIVMMKLKEEFEIHDTLNPKLFENNRMIPEVRERLIEIVKTFEEYIEVPIDIVDVQAVGSNCSYNYTANSDLDVHVIASFESVDSNKEILQALYNEKKSDFNRDLDISIHNIQVEIYVQDIKSTCVSNGIYSICDDLWIKEPKPIKSATKMNIESDVEKWATTIQQVIASGDYDSINSTINSLYLMRTNSIATDGEHGKGNQIFKDIRNKGLLKKLKEALYDSMSNRLTLENYSRGQWINRMED